MSTRGVLPGGRAQEAGALPGRREHAAGRRVRDAGAAGAVQAAARPGRAVHVRERDRERARARHAAAGRDDAERGQARDLAALPPPPAAARAPDLRRRDHSHHLRAAARLPLQRRLRELSPQILTRMNLKPVFITPLYECCDCMHLRSITYLSLLALLDEAIPTGKLMVYSYCTRIRTRTVCVLAYCMYEYDVLMNYENLAP